MKEVQATAAKAHLAQLLDDVEKGETIVITRHGKAIARLVPEANSLEEQRRDAIMRLKELRSELPVTSHAEIIAAKHEGHRF